MKEKIKLIKLKESTHKILDSVGKRGESFDDIVKRLAEKEVMKNKIRKKNEVNK